MCPQRSRKASSLYSASGKSRLKRGCRFFGILRLAKVWNMKKQLKQGEKLIYGKAIHVATLMTAASSHCWTRKARDRSALCRGAAMTATRPPSCCKGPAKLVLWIMPYPLLGALQPVQKSFELTPCPYLRISVCLLLLYGMDNLRPPSRTENGPRFTLGLASYQQ